MGAELFVDLTLELRLKEEFALVCKKLEIVHLFGHFKVHKNEGDGFIWDHKVSVELLKDCFQTLRALYRSKIDANMKAFIY